MEAAGGILASQLAAMYVQQSGSASFSMVFGYLRKNRKSSGTKQQLEGPAAAVLEQRFAKKLKIKLLKIKLLKKSNFFRNEHTGTFSPTFYHFFNAL
jgi:hypothetical protein